MSHLFTCRVYYEDTDMAGIVYYANYLKFIERARSTLVREAGVDQMTMRADGFVFAVTHLEADFKGSAVLDDELTVITKLKHLNAVKIVFEQQVSCNGNALFNALVTVACVSNSGRATRMPADVLAKIKQFAA